MNALLLAKIQFGVSVGLHYLFPLTTLGFAFLILIFETLFLRRRLDVHRQVAVFLTKLLGLMFTVGVATGLVLPFEVGGNWARFTTHAGSIFGSMMSIEASTAFALESAFMGVLLFGRSKVSPFWLWVSTVGLFVGSHFSAFLVVGANSWLQTPAGFVLENGRLVMTSLPEALFNHSTVVRFVHVITTAWLTGAFVACAIAAYYAARQRHLEFTRALFAVAMPLMLAMALSTPLVGDLHIRNVLAHNPEKSAAYEGVFYSTNGATLYAFGIPDEKHRTIHLGIGMPCALSFMETRKLDGRVRGLDEFPETTWPPVNVIFTTFHLMVMLGMAMIGISATGVFLLFRKKLESARWYLLVLPWVVPLPYLANELGWIGAEMGRQPWLIYKVMRTAEASSPNLPGWQVGMSLAGISVIYLLLIVFTLAFLRREIRKGPGEELQI